VSTTFNTKVDHVVGGGPYHCVWDNALRPVVTIDPRETVLLHCLEATGGQYSPHSTAADVKRIDLSRVHTLTGPVAVRGAMPGDTLAVEILAFQHEGWAWTSVEPGFGILASEFGDEYALKIWRVDRGAVSFRPGIRIPVEPFCGVMGVAPKEPGAVITIPPRACCGGNMDCKHLRPGATVFFPVHVPGGLFSVGDGHLAQGDGEVCGTAVEAPVSIAVRISLIKNQTIPTVRYETHAAALSPIDAAGHLVTTAAGQDLQQLAKTAVSEMVELLTSRFQLSRMDAYVICSAAGNLKIAVPVLGPRHAGFVTFHMPRSIFDPDLRRNR
jgi:acetamidase/formamidase